MIAIQGTIAIDLQLVLTNEWLKPLPELLLAKLFTLPLLQDTTDTLRWNENTADDLDNTILSNPIFNRHVSETVDLYANQAPIAANIDAERLVLKESGQIDVEEAFRNATLVNSLGLVKSIRVECLVCNDVVC